MRLEIDWMSRDETGLQLLAQCFARNDSPKSIELLRWQYLQNPAGGPLVAIGRDGETASAENVAGIYAVFPVRVRLEGSLTLAAQSLDTLTDARYRGQGLFPKLARSVYQEAVSSRGIDFVYGFPNAFSAPGFFGKLGWVALDPLPFLICPLRSRYFAARVPGLGSISSMLPDWSLRRLSKATTIGGAIATDLKFGPETDSVWTAFCAHCGVAVDRSAEYLNWRFTSKPGEEYQSVGWRDQSGKLLAFCVFALKDKHGGRIGYVMELLYVPGYEDAASACLAHSIAAMQLGKADAILAWCMPHSINHAVYREQGFRVLPERLRPIELHFGCVPFASAGEAASKSLLNRERWYLSYCDSDTV